MVIKIIFSGHSKNILSEIYKFYKLKVNLRIAKAIKSKIISRANELKTHPNLGQKELSIKNQEDIHNYLLSGNYKIIYIHFDGNIIITDIFDVRQNPTKINKENR